MKKYVKEYKGHKVPEWATHVSDFQTPQPIEFYRAIGGEHQFFNTGAVNPVWCKSVFNEPNKWEIELPEAPQEWSGEGLPPIGCKCEVDTAESAGLSNRELEINGEEVTVIANVKNKHGYEVTVFEASSGGVFCFSSKLFRPLKTQQEKDREAFIEAAKICTEGTLLNNDDPEVVAFIENLISAEFTAPKAAK